MKTLKMGFHHSSPNHVSISFYKENRGSGMVVYMDEDDGMEVIGLLSIEQVGELVEFLQSHLDRYSECEFGWTPR